MRLCFAILSPTWGMHQYTAGLANRQSAAGQDVHVVTTCHAPRDRYAPAVILHTPVAARDSGFSWNGLRQARSVRCQVAAAFAEIRPEVVHLTAPHLWNPYLLSALRRDGVPAVQTIHDLHPHAGAGYGRLLYLWNRQVRKRAGHLLVHGRCWQEELLAAEQSPDRVTSAPLTHLFVSHAREQELRRALPVVRYEPWALLIGRLEKYKGLDVLVEAARRLPGSRTQVVIAGPGTLSRVVKGPLPGNVEVRDRLIGDEEAVELFARCGLVVLPYVEASQSALIAAAYFFRKPVIVTRVGALPEYVMEGETGLLIPPNEAGALAETLQTALGDPARLKEMGEAGKAWYDRTRAAEGRTLREMYACVEGRGGAEEQRR